MPYTLMLRQELQPICKNFLVDSYANRTLPDLYTIVFLAKVDIIEDGPERDVASHLPKLYPTAQSPIGSIAF
jgi:hypothetical protein